MNEQTYPEGLKMFHDGEEWVIASSPEDAAKVYAAHVGEQFTTPSDDMAVWEEEPPGKMFMFTDGDESGANDTFAGHVRRIGKRGYFASANY